jgi:hypothetical protein
VIDASSRRAIAARRTVMTLSVARPWSRRAGAAPHRRARRCESWR